MIICPWHFANLVLRQGSDIHEMTNKGSYLSRSEQIVIEDGQRVTASQLKYKPNKLQREAETWPESGYMVSFKLGSDYEDKITLWF